MNGTERRTGEQGGAYIGGRWVSDDELRARGRRATDSLARAAEGRDYMGTCPNCGERRPGATDGPGGSLFAVVDTTLLTLWDGRFARAISHAIALDFPQSCKRKQKEKFQLGSPG